MQRHKLISQDICADDKPSHKGMFDKVLDNKYAQAQTALVNSMTDRINLNVRGYQNFSERETERLAMTQRSPFKDTSSTLGTTAQSKMNVLSDVILHPYSKV